MVIISVYAHHIYGRVWFYWFMIKFWILIYIFYEFLHEYPENVWGKECDLVLESIDLIYNFTPLKQIEVETCVRYCTEFSAYISPESRQEKTTQTFSSTTRHKLVSINFSNLCSSSKFNPCRSSPLTWLSSMDHYMSQHCK
jgi:hypothetical protein